MDRESVNFYSAGHKLQGYFYMPKNPKGKVPGLVICHGFSAMIETITAGVPEALSDAGYAVLLYYSRGVGESEGPRGRVIPMEQVDDIRNALTYMQCRDEVDPNRVALYGSAFGCSTGVVAAAMDKRVKCFVGNVGMGDCERWLKSERSRWDWIAFLKRLEADRRQRVLTGKSEIVQPNEIHIPDRVAAKARDQKWEEFRKKSGYDGYPLETAEALIEFKPELVIDRISPRPLMLIAMEFDVTSDVEETRSMFEKAHEPKKLVIMEGAVHYDAFKFTNPVVFEKIMKETIDFYHEHLPL
ncbi:MAG TPA: alpha/beta fold hydrolase [Bauldia sp.]|nr:alpha/beta fold hydrolase [Bauldia sp.]